MSLKNSSSLINLILKYLKVKDDNSEIISLINECIQKIENSNGFKYLYKRYSKRLEFLNNKPYCDFLEGCEEYYLVAATLGLEVERMINYLGKTDLQKMVVMDATASALLELKADEFEKTLNEELTYRFCPGYSKSNIEDIKIIHKELKAEKIGIEVLDSCMMVPQKSMIGIVGIKNSKVI